MRIATGIVVTLLCLQTQASEAGSTFTAFGPESYERVAGPPQTVTTMFSVLNPETAYVLEVFNGGIDGDLPRASSAVVKLNGETVFGTSNFNQQVAYLQAPVDLDVTNQLSIKINSQPGATLTLKIVGVDEDSPTIIGVLSPLPNAAGWNNTDVTITFACDDLTSGVASCSEPVVLPNEGGNQVVTGSAVDVAGNSASVDVTVSIDKSPPDVAVTFPPHDLTQHDADLMLAGDISDGVSGVSGVSCNGTAASISDSSFECSLILPEGSNMILVQGTDLAGNTGTAIRTVTFARLPQITITSPANVSSVNISPTTVTGNVDDPTATVTVNAISAAVVDGGFSVAIPLAEGPNVVTASASTPVGTVGTHSIQVTLDTMPPRVTITSPPNEFVTTDGAISVAGIVNDIVVGTVNEGQAQVSVNGTAAGVANRTFLATDVELVVGENVVQAIGIDQVGNSATTEILVTRVTPGQEPRIVTVSGNGQSGAIGSVLAEPLVVELVDGTGEPAPGETVIFRVSQNDGMVSAGEPPAASLVTMTDALGRAQVDWTLGGRAGAGANSVEAYAVGFEGTALFTASATQGPAGNVVVDSGNAQIGVIGQPLPKPLIAVVVDGGNNRVADVPVTFTVVEGGGSVDGEPSFTVNTDSDGRAAATWTLGPLEGNANNLVEVTFPSNQGFPVAFTASGRVSGDPLQTTISGVVLDNSNVPIPGVMMRAVLTHDLRANPNAVQEAVAVPTDAEGQFGIPEAPVGFVKLLVDGSTAELPGEYPALEYDMVTVAGQDNTVGMPIYLLPLGDDELCVTATEGGGTLTVPEAPGFSLTFGPGQVTFPGGSQTGCVSVTVVHGDKVPMVPGFGQQPRFIVTIQPAGAVFSPPAPITLPNVDGLAPRAVTEMYSFDHDIGSFVAIGTGTVGDDGLAINSDPGVGVLKAGWHCGGNPAANGTVADCPKCKWCQSNTCVADPAQDGSTCETNKICKNGNCVCPIPTNFRQTAASDAGGGTLHFEYAWDSSTGDLSNLANCTFSERVDYGAADLPFPSPPFPSGLNPPNPTILSVPGIDGAAQDNHSTPGAFVQPYQAATVTATQRYRYTCSCANNGNPVVIDGPLNLIRAVSQKPDGNFKFTITKSGHSASIDPLP